MQVFTKLQTVFVILWLADQFSRIASQTCSGDNSVYGYMLRGNIFKTLQTALPFECSQACEGDVRCQSFNYVISKNTCELNDRTKKARPADFLPSSERYYYEKSKNRAALGSIPELPAKNCREIKLSEGEQTVSGKYWYYNPWTDTATFAYCDMKTEDVDECEYDLYYCEANSYCSNTVGSYICTSDRGLASSSILNNSPKYYIGTLSSYLDPVLTNLSSSRFVRCYHAKTDGWDSTTFHSKCDGKGPTVSIIQVGNYTFGGYTDVSWQSSCGYTSAAKAFIFSLYNVHGYKPVKLAQYRYQGYAIYRCSSYGPTFGGYQGRHDIQLRNNAGNIQNSFTTCGSTYGVPTGYISFTKCVFFSGSELFTPTNLEVFYEITS